MAEKTRNNGTMTESQFWAGIRSALRQKSRFWWKPIQIAKNKSKRPYKGKNKRQKWEYQCTECNKWVDGKNIAVDHIVGAGSLKSAKDLEGFIDYKFFANNITKKKPISRDMEKKDQNI
jgi:hypothetical protein